jgi:hypothetical protein
MPKCDGSARLIFKTMDDIEYFQNRLMDAIHNHDTDIKVVIIHPDTYEKMKNENEKYLRHHTTSSFPYQTITGLRVIRSTDVDEFEFDIY